MIETRKFKSWSRQLDRNEKNAAVTKRLFHKPLKSTRDSGTRSWVVLPAIWPFCQFLASKKKNFETVYLLIANVKYWFSFLQQNLLARVVMAFSPRVSLSDYTTGLYYSPTVLTEGKLMRHYRWYLLQRKKIPPAPLTHHCSRVYRQSQQNFNLSPPISYLQNPDPGGASDRKEHVPLLSRPRITLRA